MHSLDATITRSTNVGLDCGGKLTKAQKISNVTALANGVIVVMEQPSIAFRGLKKVGWNCPIRQSSKKMKQSSAITSSKSDESASTRLVGTGCQSNLE